MIDRREIIGDALAEFVERARKGLPKVRVGLMAAGSELGARELLSGAELAMSQDSMLQVVAIGVKMSGYKNLEWIEAPAGEADITAAMEASLARALSAGRLRSTTPFHWVSPQLGVSSLLLGASLC